MRTVLEGCAMKEGTYSFSLSWNQLVDAADEAAGDATEGLLPVGVFFHGGAFKEGSSRGPFDLYEGSVFAARSNVIVVTATRREMDVQDIPISVTAFSQEELTIKGIVGYEGLALETPGAVLNKPTANFNTFSVRGIATNGYGANLQNTVAVYIDELPISANGNSTQLDSTLFDVERVEFLRGPQGTLFGSGSLAGAVRILTKSPDLNDFDAETLVDWWDIGGAWVVH